MHTRRALMVLLLGMVAVADARAQDGAGEIRGRVVAPLGQPVASQRVELRLPPQEGPLRLVATTDVDGQFTYPRLRPGRYDVELRENGRVVARSGPIELADGAMHVEGVTLTLPGTLDEWDGTVASSFEALQPFLEVGQQVTLSDDILDSRWKGLVIGTAVGATVAGLARGAFAAGMGAVLGGGIGYTIDYYSYGGTRVTGKVVSISGDQLVISRRRALFRSEELAFTEDVVRSIRIVDSEWNGLLLGAAPGIALFFVSCSGADANNLCGLGPSVVTGIGMVVGGAIDELMTQPVYERKSHAPRVTISPLLGRERMGLLARVQF